MDNLERILRCLHQLLAPELASASARLSASGSDRGYVYVRTGADRFLLYAEAVPAAGGDEPPGTSARSAQVWESLGWNAPLPGDSFYFQTWRVVSEEDRRDVARQLEQALTQGLGVRLNDPLTIDVLID